MNYKFKLEKLLELKCKREDSLKLEMSEYLNKIKIKKDHIENIKEKINFSKNNKINSAFSYDLKNYISYINYLESKLIEEQKNLIILENELEKIKEQLINATKERKVLENLKEKSYNEFLSELNKIENKIIDEMAIINYFKKNGGII
ncbi:MULTISPECIES: flagellar export protein FliJ [Caloramator]|uniref:Flagellar FliJ protein n=1 Tax=Caloramator proteoclasticus DSM 10124 TaxID=1121262 RepID=A0A1M4STW1_9CLOT|nr:MULTISPECIES: flagellar export protein FliJ [Caloramator]SHE35605.1 flagellar FliJ protein [Caloramator proteoclasticus DSM 10124]